MSAMDVEFGLKLTKTMDDLTSFTDFQLSKDRAGPVFLSREDVNMFILTVHLRGFKKENINIEISKDGTQISVHAEKPVQQTVTIGHLVHKKWTELKVFRKVFKIPDGVVLDLIKVEFKEGSILTIIMPKQEKGSIGGVRIEEVKEEEVGRATAKSEREIVAANEFPERDKVGVGIKKEYEVPMITTKESDHVVEKEIDRWGSEKTRTVEEEFPKKEYIGKTLPEITEKPKVESTEETQEYVSTFAEETKPQEVSTIEPRVAEPWNETDTPRKELPQLIEQRKEIPEVKKADQRGLEEEKSIKDEGRHKIPQEPQRQMSHTDITDSTKSKLDQERAATPQLHYPVEQHGKDEVTEREKTSGIGDKILEASNERSQEKEGESSKAGQKDLGEGTAQEKKAASKRCKLCAPCVVGVGSAILISFIALVIHGAKRRQEKGA